MNRENNIKKITWVYISGAAFILFLIAAVGIIIFADRLAQFGITKSFYYLLLIPIGLCASGFLFGALHSHAKYVGKSSYGQLELTGPVVLFCLVVVGGFYFAEPESNFVLTIRTSAEPDKVITNGLLKVALGNQSETRSINENGEVIFTEVPSRYKGKEITINPVIEGYVAKKTSYIIPADNIIRYELVPAKYLTNIRGTVIDSRGKVLSGVTINFESGRVISESNEQGNFAAALPLKAGSTIHVIASRNGKVGYRELLRIPESEAITILFNTDE